MKTLKERTEIQQAFLDGKEIEMKLEATNEWRDAGCEITFDSWKTVDYRVKPKPMEIWVKFTPNGVTYLDKIDSNVPFLVNLKEAKIIKFIQAPDDKQ